MNANSFRFTGFYGFARFIEGGYFAMEKSDVRY